MDDEWDDLHGEVHDLDGEAHDLDGGGWADVTGNPAEDIPGYSSPSRRGQNLSGFRPSRDNRAAEALAQSKRHREQRAAKRAETRQAKETRQAVVGSDEWRAARAARWEALGWLTPPAGHERVEQKSQPVQTESRDEIAARSLTELQPGQHGAFFERRIKRCRWAPWKKRTVWQQTSAWMATTPPTSGTEVVTVGDVSELPGKVHTIAAYSPDKPVVY
jgi:hypothetical protein